MAEYKLTYFNAKGLGESIRYMLSYMGKEFKDLRVSKDEWESVKAGTPFGKIPTLEIDGKVFHQTSAILRYLAVEAGLSGETPCENLQIDQIAGAIMDFSGEFVRWVKLEGKAKDDFKKHFLNEILPFYFGKFDQIIKENSGYLANGKLSWADFLLVSYSDPLISIFEITDFQEKYPNFKSLFDRVQSLPGIKEWVNRSS